MVTALALFNACVTAHNNNNNNTSRCSVSWHADSCLEHYSTIGVYHYTDPETDPADWRIALRVERDAEGPSSGKLKHTGGGNNKASNDFRKILYHVIFLSRAFFVAV